MLNSANKRFIMPKSLILIPARFASTRFPGKPLTPILNKTMIERVYQNAASSGAHTVVVTDSAEIEKEVKLFGGNVCRIDDDVPSGSERIGLCYERFYKDEKFDLVINVQGDEPLLPGSELKKLIAFHHQSKFDITTLVRKRVDAEGFLDPNRVKAVLGANGECLYFSRASVPHYRDNVGGSGEWYLHIGVYSYRPAALKRFLSLPMSRLEAIEKLEQLRALENGMKIGAIESGHDLIGVDTPEDVLKVEGVLRGKTD